MRSGIWRFAVAPSDAAEKNRNRSLHNYNPSRITAQIYFLYDFWCAQSHRALFGLPIRFWRLRYVAMIGKIFTCAP